MRRRAVALVPILCIGIGVVGLAGQTVAPPGPLDTVPGSGLRVWLITVGPGEAVWQRFGHNALRVLDASTGVDVSYNWGVFDFNQVDFVSRFLKGRMLYRMAPFRTGPMVDAYAATGRRVVMQELGLTPAQRLVLKDFAERNALPENREYYYDYFLDNCSTRVRDLLDQVLGGVLAQRFNQGPSGTSFRYHVRRLTRSDPLLFTGMDVLLGSRGDRPISIWEEMFLPMVLRDAVRDVSVRGEDGLARPLVMAEDVLAPGPGPGEPEGPPSWLPFYLVLGLAMGGALAWSGAGGAMDGRWRRIVFVALGTVWSVTAGAVGTILVLVLFTDHEFMAWNANVFLLNPLSLALAFLVPLAVRRPRARGAAERLALTVAGVAVVGVALRGLPAFRQDNAIFLALVVPAHVGLWWALRRTRHAGLPAGPRGPDRAPRSAHDAQHDSSATSFSKVSAASLIPSASVR